MLVTERRREASAPGTRLPQRLPWDRCAPSGGHQSCMICLSPSSIARISPSLTTPKRPVRRSLATARIWSLTATAGRPSQATGTRIGGP